MTRTIFAAALLAATSITLPSYAAQQEGPAPTQVLLSIESKAAPVLTLDQISARVNNHETPLTSLTAVAPSGLQVALLIDDGLRSSAGRQLDDIRKFVLGLRPGTEIYVGYMQNGRVVGPANGFTTDFAAAAKEVRLPLGTPGINASPYFCLTDFLKRWPGAAEGTDETPSEAGKARVVMMVTNGVDPYNGSVSPLNQDSPYVSQAITIAQRAGVPVYSIYYGDAGVRGGAASFSGQGYLQQIADATGGQSFYIGTWSPVSLGPFFDQFQHALAETYVATFPAAGRGSSRDLAQLKLSTKQHGMKLHAPAEVRPGTMLLSNGGAGATGSLMR